MLRRRQLLAALGAPSVIHAQGVSGWQLRSRNGLRACVIDWGATLTELAPAGWPNLVLSLPSRTAYAQSARRWAGTLGRYAGRLAPGGFVLDGRRVALRADAPTLHGGAPGFDRRPWALQGLDDDEGVGLLATLDSPDGDQGFPGRLQVRQQLQLLHNAPTLRLRYEARSDAATVVNLTNHAYLNLGGAGRGRLADHRFRLAPSCWVELDARKLPTGRLLDAEPELDFSDWRAVPEQPLDHVYALKGYDGTLRQVAEVEHLPSGRQLALWSTQPALVFNSGDGFDGSEIGSEGVAYRRRAGFALEAQFAPDSPNQPGFPSAVLRPGETWRATLEWRFGQRDNSAQLNQRTISRKTHG